ncbi:MAG: MATE family efflux transporter [Proteobacteria bacterium]|nr:MATE family efflux transporter [Pseudomonadota bacterium]
MSDAAAAVAPSSLAQSAAPSRLQAAGAERKARARAAMLEGPIVSTLVRMALPTIGVMIAQTAVGIAETYYVGFLGTDALAGVALVFPIFMLMATTSNGGLGSGVASAVARAIGAGRQQDADALVFHSIVVAIVCGALFTGGILWAGPALYGALGGRDASLVAALDYSDILFSGAIAVWIVNLLAAALRGSGNVKVPALVTLVGAIVMIPISPALIFGFGPIPRLGIAGAGVAFNLYYVGALFVMLRYMRSGRSGLTLTVTPLQGRLFADILKVGLPTAFNAVQTNLCVILVTGAVGLFGTAALAGYGTASRLDYVLIPILFGLSSAVLTMVGINVGAGQGARARHIAWISMLVGAGLTGAIGIAAALLPTLWVGLFTHDPEVMAAGAPYLRIVGPFYAFYGVGFVMSFAAQGAGKTLWPTIAVSFRLAVAAGGSWIAVAAFGGTMTTLTWIVAASFVAYALLSAGVMLQRAAWAPKAP